MYCPKCYRMIPDDSAFCPNCGTSQEKPTCINCGTQMLPGEKFCRKCGVSFSQSGESKGSRTTQMGNDEYVIPQYHEKPKNKHKVRSFIIGLVILVMGGFLFISGIMDAVGASPAASKPAVSEAQYISMCNEISYDELARNPESKKGMYYTFYGEVIQVIEDGDDVQLRINVTPVMLFDEVSYYEDTIFVVTELKTNGQRILEGDMIRIYGECIGLITYNSLFDQQISIPGISAPYWDIE